METSYTIRKQCNQCGSMNDKKDNMCGLCRYLMTYEVTESTWTGPKELVKDPEKELIVLDLSQ